MPDSKVIKKLVETFEADWKANDATKEREIEKEEVEVIPDKDTKKATQILAKEMRPISATLKKAVKKAVADSGQEALERSIVKKAVKKIVKQAVKEAVKEVAQQTT